jgi:hypothetical protein
MFPIVPTNYASLPSEERPIHKIYWLSPDIDRWRLQREGAPRAERIFSDHTEAMTWARRHASENAPCRLKFQDNSGRVIEQIDFLQTHLLD